MRKTSIAVSAMLCLASAQFADARAATFSDLVNVEGVGQSNSCTGSVFYVTHKGGYVADVEFVAPVNGGTQTLLLGQCLTASGSLVYSRMKIYSETGLVWDPKKLFVDVNLNDEAKPGCSLEFIISGTTLDPKVTKVYHNTFSPDHVC